MGFLNFGLFLFTFDHWVVVFRWSKHDSHALIWSISWIWNSRAWNFVKLGILFNWAWIGKIDLCNWLITSLYDVSQLVWWLIAQFGLFFEIGFFKNWGFCSKTLCSNQLMVYEVNLNKFQCIGACIICAFIICII